MLWLRYWGGYENKYKCCLEKVSMTHKIKIKQILDYHLNELINKLTKDFPQLYNKKETNWILSSFDSNLLSNMVFVSSFESKSGNMMEDVARDIAKLTFGTSKVPKAIKGANITSQEFQTFSENYNKKPQIIVSKRNLNECKTSAHKLQINNKGDRNNISTLNQKIIREIYAKKIRKVQDINTKPVDLIIDTGKKLMLFEMKAGGNLDSSKAPGDIEKMLTWACMLDRPCELYFSTLYHKDGEGNTWKGSVKKYLSPDAILIGSKFWEKILPSDVSFKDFLSIYDQSCFEVGLHDKLSSLIRSVVKN